MDDCCSHARYTTTLSSILLFFNDFYCSFNLLAAILKLYFNHRIVNLIFLCACFVTVAVVVAFFFCWAPFHAQRLLAMYLSSYSKADETPPEFLDTIFNILNYVSGVLYYMSTTVNPVLYNIMSNKFRDAFKVSYFILIRTLRILIFCYV